MHSVYPIYSFCLYGGAKVSIQWNLNAYVSTEKVVTLKEIPL